MRQSYHLLYLTQKFCFVISNHVLFDYYHWGRQIWDSTTNHIITVLNIFIPKLVKSCSEKNTNKHIYDNRNCCSGLSGTTEQTFCDKDFYKSFWRPGHWPCYILVRGTQTLRGRFGSFIRHATELFSWAHQMEDFSFISVLDIVIDSTYCGYGSSDIWGLSKYI
jgi:hypothetical protein